MFGLKRVGMMDLDERSHIYLEVAKFLCVGIVQQMGVSGVLEWTSQASIL